MSNDIERRAFAVDRMAVERAKDDKGESRLIVGHAAVFNRDADIGGWFIERVAPGAFKRAIKEDDVRSLFNHDPNFVLGRNKAGTLKLEEDKEGLLTTTIPPDTQIARDLLVSIERGDISQMSFGFRVTKQEWDDSDEKMLKRTILEVELFDVSPVTFPAYVQTDVGLRSVIASAPEWIAERLERRFASDVLDAVEWLKKAIARHERHMDGSEPTSDASQMQMMKEMKNALAALDDESGEEMKKARAALRSKGLTALNTGAIVRQKLQLLRARGE